jgi:hypothetical protein
LQLVRHTTTTFTTTTTTTITTTTTTITSLNVGLSSKQFALKLLREKGCAIAPGSAFDTSDPSRSDQAIISNQAIISTTSQHAYDDNYNNNNNNNNNRYISALEQFCRVSLANSEDNVSAGMHLICDLLEELESR